MQFITCSAYSKRVLVEVRTTVARMVGVVVAVVS